MPVSPPKVGCKCTDCADVHAHVHIYTCILIVCILLSMVIYVCICHEGVTGQML